MKKKTLILTSYLIALLIMTFIGACTDHGKLVTVIPSGDGDSSSGDTLISFSKSVHPVLLTTCGSVSCHGGDQPKHGFSVKNYGTIMDSVPHRHVVRGSAINSAMYLAVTVRYPEVPLIWRMPNSANPGDTLSSAVQDTIKKWIDQGAKDN